MVSVGDENFSALAAWSASFCWSSFRWASRLSAGVPESWWRGSTTARGEASDVLGIIVEGSSRSIDDDMFVSAGISESGVDILVLLVIVFVRLMV